MTRLRVARYASQAKRLTAVAEQFRQSQNTVPTPKRSLPKLRQDSSTVKSSHFDLKNCCSKLWRQCTRDDGYPSDRGGCYVPCSKVKFIPACARVSLSPRIVSSCRCATIEVYIPSGSVPPTLKTQATPVDEGARQHNNEDHQLSEAMSEHNCCSKLLRTPTRVDGDPSSGEASPEEYTYIEPSFFIFKWAVHSGAQPPDGRTTRPTKRIEKFDDDLHDQANHRRMKLSQCGLIAEQSRSPPRLEDRGEYSGARSPSKRHLHRIVHTVVLPKVRKEPRQFPIYETSNRRSFYDLGDKVGMCEGLGTPEHDYPSILRDELFESRGRFHWSDTVAKNRNWDAMVSMRVRKSLSCSARWSRSDGDIILTTSRKATSHGHIPAALAGFPFDWWRWGIIYERGMIQDSKNSYTESLVGKTLGDDSSEGSLLNLMTAGDELTTRKFSEVFGRLGYP
ncbi:hypothetical protein IW262DRAFT_1483919 [Armillaria fumosa]|nr:hypothetical protein IW262DRAFT_1483919 [Armillaria fumosa]